MSEVLRCPVCDNTVQRSTQSVVAPFLEVRCGLDPNASRRSYFCDRCDHVFMTPMLTSDQLAKLYTGYRGEAYNVQRVAVEPSYAPLIPEFDNITSGYFQARAANYDQLLAEYKSLSGNVVDFGGADGYWSKYCFPNGNCVVADESFERDGGNLQKLLAECDMLFCAHVFEHIPQPAAQLNQLTRYLKPGALVWIELPVQYPGALRDAYAVVESRVAAGDPAHDSALVVLHEHVAHFSKRSAKMLATRGGLAVEEVVVFPGGLAVMARKPV
jgi:hypothetical protein